MPLEKQSLNNFLPDGFETLNQEGYKTNFSEDKIKTGYEKDIKDRVSGPNLNNLIDVVGKNTNILSKFLDFIKSMPINSVLKINNNNQIDYHDIGDIDNKVSKSGDTMTGELVGNVVNSPYPFIAQSNIMDITTTPTAHQYIGYDFRDKNNVRIGWAGVVNDTNGSKYFQIQNLGGVNGFQFPMCTTKPTTTSTASNHHVSAVTQNYVNGTSGYIVFSDKLGIQWGEFANTTGGNLTKNTITFLKPFANANYMIQRTNIGSSGDGGSLPYAGITSKTASNFVALTTTSVKLTTFSWVAIGYIA